MEPYRLSFQIEELLSYVSWSRRNGSVYREPKKQREYRPRAQRRLEGQGAISVARRLRGLATRGGSLAKSALPPEVIPSALGLVGSQRSVGVADRGIGPHVSLGGAFFTTHRVSAAR